MVSCINNFIRNEKMHFKIFDLGLFFLASAPSISVFFLIISSFTGGLNRKDKFFTDKLNYSFFIAGLLILISSISLFFFGDLKFNLNTVPKGHFNYDVGKLSLLLGSINWVPFFYIYWSFKKFLSTETYRRRCANILILGTLPVLLSGILQKIFKLYGPFSILDNFIIWYQKPGEALTAVFNNSNYAAAWLSLILPFCFSKILSNKMSDIKKISYLILTITTIACIVLTYSKNGLLAIIISSVVMLDIFSKLYVWLPTLIILILFLLSTFLINPDVEIIPFRELLKKMRFPELNNFNEIPRVKIYRSSLFYIFQNPFLGWGAATFPLVYQLHNKVNKVNRDLLFYSTQHTHNIFLEVAYTYGIPVCLLIFIPISLIIYKSSINKNSQNYYYEKAWKLSTILFIVISQFDFTYYDVRISILFWILVSGLSCFNSPNNKLKDTN